MISSSRIAPIFLDRLAWVLGITKGKPPQEEFALEWEAASRGLFLVADPGETMKINKDVNCLVIKWID